MAVVFGGTPAETLLHRSRPVAFRFSTFHQEENLAFLDDLTSKPWEAYSVSRLFNFDSSELQQRRYAKKIREGVASTLEHDGTAEVTATVQSKEGFHMTDFDMPAVSIEVTVSDYQTKRSKFSRTLSYVGYLISRGQLNSQGTEPQLPLLLCRSSREVLTGSVHAVLESLFDSHVTKLELKQSDLQWMLAIMLEYQPEDEDQDVTLSYLPLSLPKDKVDFALSITSLQKLWSHIRDGGVGVSETDEKEVGQLFNVLAGHISGISQIQLSRMVLTSVSSKYASFYIDGKLLFRSTEVAEVILRFLTMQLSLEDRFDMQQFKKTEHSDRA